MLTRDDLHVGQRVWVSDSSRKWPWRRSEAVKIGRLLVRLAPVLWEGTDKEQVGGWPEEFRIGTQQLNSPVNGYGTCFRTDEQHEAALRRGRVKAYLRSQGVTLEHRCEVTDEHREQLAGFLRGLGYE